MPGTAAGAAEAGPNRGHRRCHARQGTQEFGSAEDSDAEDTGVLGVPAAMGRQQQQQQQQRRQPDDDDGGERAAATAADGGLDGWVDQVQGV